MKRLIDRAGWALAGALALMLVLVAARAIQAGPLDPPGPVASTMKTLDGIPPSWDQILSTSGADSCNTARFKCVMAGAAVLDHETGLVWEQAPSSAGQHWYSSVRFCQNAQIGGRYGWRLPSIEEARSLLDGTGTLPAGVFNNVQAGHYYWSASAEIAGPVLQALMIRFDAVAPNLSVETGAFAATQHAWCVRGGAGTEGQPHRAS